MSLLITGPDTVTLIPAVKVTGPDGLQRWQPGTDRVELAGASVQGSSTSDVSEGNAQRGYTAVRVIARALPSGATVQNMEFGLVEWNGSRWKLNGKAREYRRGQLTAHITWTMTEV